MTPNKSYSAKFDEALRDILFKAAGGISNMADNEMDQIKLLFMGEGLVNSYADLPRNAMRKVHIAFDVDGTLRCNCTETCIDPNPRIVDLFKILQTFKNVELHVWSGGGADYALRFAREFGLGVKEQNCRSKFATDFKPDIAIDDIQETDLGTLNLIVKEK